MPTAPWLADIQQTRLWTRTILPYLPLMSPTLPAGIPTRAMALPATFIDRPGIMFRAIYVLVAACCLVLSATIWSAEKASPDDLWVANADTKQYGGPGTAAIITTVSLKRPKGSRAPINILVFEQQSKLIDLALNWTDSTHLEVTYHNATIDFQAVRCGGVTISVKDTST